MSAPDSWNVAQYEKFKDQRARPFHDLLGMVDLPGIRRVIDLGCGTGELTRVLHERTGAESTLGLDSSAKMLATANAQAGRGLSFLHRELAAYSPNDLFDLVFSNAALNWVPDHPALFQRLAQWLPPGGQLAVQVPAQHDHVTYWIAGQVASEKPFREYLQGFVRVSPVLTAEEYAELLHRLRFTEQRVRVEIYGHPMDDRGDVVEWVKGTWLTDYEKRLTPLQYQEFLNRYRERVLAALGPPGPYFYPFKRILLWGRKSPV